MKKVGCGLAKPVSTCSAAPPRLLGKAHHAGRHRRLSRKRKNHGVQLPDRQRREHRVRLGTRGQPRRDQGPGRAHRRAQRHLPTQKDHLRGHLVRGSAGPRGQRRRWLERHRQPDRRRAAPHGRVGACHPRLQRGARHGAARRHHRRGARSGRLRRGAGPARRDGAREPPRAPAQRRQEDARARGAGAHFPGHGGRRKARALARPRRGDAVDDLGLSAAQPQAAARAGELRRRRRRDRGRRARKAAGRARRAARHRGDVDAAQHRNRDRSSFRPKTSRPFSKISA